MFILENQNDQDVVIDEQKMKNIPVNSKEPLFLAAEVFRDTLIELGISHETAEMARKTFYAFKLEKAPKNSIQDQFMRISSQLEIIVKNQCNQKSHALIPGKSLLEIIGSAYFLSEACKSGSQTPRQILRNYSRISSFSSLCKNNSVQNVERSAEMDRKSNFGQKAASKDGIGANNDSQKNEEQNSSSSGEIEYKFCLEDLISNVTVGKPNSHKQLNNFSQSFSEDSIEKDK